MRLPAKIFAVLGLPLALSSCGGSTGESLASTPLPTEGPAADYPMVIGAPYVIDGVQYTPSDQLNYDQVGLATLDASGGAAITAENRTLPLPSYIEVTSLETGRTILVRVERRGPMIGNSLIGLSSGALRQMGATSGTPVRVRRVNPPEAERALLRRGEPAPERMATPMPLVEVLRRKLGGSFAPLIKEEPQNTAPPSAPVPPGPVPPASAKPASPEKHGQPKAPTPAPAPAPPPVPAPAPTAKAPPAAPASQDKRPTSAVISRAVPAPMPKGSFAVQAGAFAVEANATAVARKIDGSINRQGGLFLVRTGPFTTRNDASTSLAKVKAAGYSSARIYRVE